MQQLVFEALRLRGQRLRLASNAHKAGKVVAAQSTTADPQQQPTSLPEGLLVSSSLMLSLHCTNQEIRTIAVGHQNVQHALSYDLEGNCGLKMQVLPVAVPYMRISHQCPFDLLATSAIRSPSHTSACQRGGGAKCVCFGLAKGGQRGKTTQKAIRSTANSCQARACRQCCVCQATKFKT